MNRWSESIAVGSKKLVDKTRDKLDMLFKNRKVAGKGGQ